MSFKSELRTPNSELPKTCFQFLAALTLFIICITSPARASDALQSTAMGDIVTPLLTPTSGARANPAGLVHTDQNHLVFDFGLDGWQHRDLEAGEDARFADDVTGRIEPGIHLTRGFGRYGISVGYLAGYDNYVRLSLLNTQSTYFVNEQRFEAQTDLVLLYETLWETEWFLAAGYKLDTADVGVRLKWIEQTAKRGEIIPSLFLYAQLEDVNPNKADEVIPAIMDNLEYDKDLIEHPLDQVELDRTVGAWDLDVGVQTDWPSVRFGIDGLNAGILLQNALQRRRVVQSPMYLAVGVSWHATDWLTAATELGKKSGETGAEFHLGWEAHIGWTHHAVGSLAIRNGWHHRNHGNYISIGAALQLGSAYWEYALSTRTSGQHLTESQHLVASTIQF